MNTTGKLNLDGKVEIEFREDAWSLLMKGLINEVRHSVLIDYTKSSKAKMGIIIERVLNSDNLQTTTIPGDIVRPEDVKQSDASGVHRAETSMVNYFCKNAWYLFGYIDNTVKKPICIVYFVEIKMAFYAIMKEGEDVKSFNPQHN
jgi:hypothetical protein